MRVELSLMWNPKKFLRQKMFKIMTNIDLKYWENKSLIQSRLKNTELMRSAFSISRFLFKTRGVWWVSHCTEHPCANLVCDLIWDKRIYTIHGKWKLLAILANAISVKEVRIERVGQCQKFNCGMTKKLYNSAGLYLCYSKIKPKFSPGLVQIQNTV